MAQKDTPHAEGAPGWPATLEEIRALDRETRDPRPPGDDRAPAPRAKWAR